MVGYANKLARLRARLLALLPAPCSLLLLLLPGPPAFLHDPEFLILIPSCLRAVFLTSLVLPHDRSLFPFLYSSLFRFNRCGKGRSRGGYLSLLIPAKGQSRTPSLLPPSTQKVGHACQRRVSPAAALAEQPTCPLTFVSQQPPCIASAFLSCDIDLAAPSPHT